MTSVNLLWELMEEILSRVPPKSLVRFRTVCKQWNALLQEKRFVINHLDHTRPQLLLFYNAKIFLIDVNVHDPSIKERQISVDIPGVFTTTPFVTTYCDGLMICEFSMNGTAVWNPFLRKGRQIMTEDYVFRSCGIGYDSSRPEMGYKIFGYYYYSGVVDKDYQKLAIYECVSDMWKSINAPYEEWPIKEPLDYPISHNGNSYWTAYNMETSEFLIRRFDFSKEILTNFCILPCKKNHEGDTHYLSILRGGRFSMLEQCYETRMIEIWVTENKIKRGDEGDVVWIKFMTILIPGIPRLFHQCYDHCPSYFVDDIYEKSFVICCYDENRESCLYVLKGDMLRRMKIESVVDSFSHSIYIPSLIPIA